MSRRINPVDVVVAFFESAPLDVVTTVLAIVRGIVARRQHATTTPSSKKRTPPPSATES